MATTYFNTREVELAVQDEATYGTDPGTPAAGDFFKHTSRLHFTPEIARYFREEDGSVGQGSVLGVQDGRQRCAVRIEVDAIPSGTGTTPPDIDLLLVNALGSKLTGTANTTTTSGSSGTSLVLTAGGGAASGIVAGMLFAVDVDATYGVEVRRCVSIATDTVTMDAALSADPLTGRDVYVGTTYKASFAAVGSLYLHQFITGVKHAIPGLILPEYEISVGYNSDTPVVKQSFGGMGKQEVVHTETRPTPTTAGDPLIPTKGYGFVGATRYCIVQATLRTNNGRALRQNESCSLEPTGVKFTENNGYTSVEEELHMLLSTGDTDTSALYNSAKAAAATPLSVIVQNGITPGKIVAWNTPKFIPLPERIEMDGEMGVKLAGRCIGTSGDDDVFVAFL
jgi:hypothetical protein